MMRISLFLIIASLVSCGKSSEPEPEISLPNILLISLDDMNNWIEPLGGHPQAQTPHLAAFAQQAVTFRRSFAASPSCNPSRTAIMTGKAPHLTGIYNNPQIWRHILPDEVTLPQYFSEAGYWTGGAGKIYHNNMPDPRSWDAYFPDSVRHMPEYYLPVRNESTGKAEFALTDNEIREDDPKGVTFKVPPFPGMYIAFDFAPLPVDTESTGDYSSVNWVSDQLKREHDAPFFLAAGLYRPHLPWYVPQKYYDRFPLDEIELPALIKDDPSDLPKRGQQIASSRYHKQVTESGLWKNAVQGYLASINYADDLVGKLLADLDASAYADNTIVVIFSDHGWQLGEKNHWRKFALWQNVLNTVLMVRVPEGIAGLPGGNYVNGVSDRNVSLVDIFPTLTELAGLSPKEGISGRSLVPLLEKPTADWDYPVVSVLGDSDYSVVHGDWHYIQYGDGGEELYDWVKDPEEWTNLAEVEDQFERKVFLSAFIPAPDQRVPLKKTGPIRWADVLSGKTSMYVSE